MLMTPALAHILRYKAPAAAAAGEESETTAWVAAVVGDGGSVSSGRRTAVNTLISGLKNDASGNLFANLDRLWIAGENTQSQLRDVVAAAAATAVNSPSFTADEGYTSNTTTSYIASGFIPSTHGVNFTLNAASALAYNRTNRTTSTGSMYLGAYDTGGTKVTKIQPFTTGALNSGNLRVTGGLNGGEPVINNLNLSTIQGLHMVNRSDSTTIAYDLNGSNLGNLASDSSQSLTPDEIYILARNPNGGTPSEFTGDQLSIWGFGGNFTSTQRTALYNHLQTYMTTLGKQVP